MESDSSKLFRQIIKAKLERRARLLQERQAAYEKWCRRPEVMG